jgi:hypothetical protein
MIPEHPPGNDVDRIISAHAIAMKPVTVSFGWLGGAGDEWCYVLLVMDPCYSNRTTTRAISSQNSYKSTCVKEQWIWGWQLTIKFLPQLFSLVINHFLHT